jgi:tellurite resistance-related uncharacterized protein
MNFQSESLPGDVQQIGTTPSMDEKTVVQGILRNHMTPKGKYALVVVEEGALQFVWEDDPETIVDADPEHPIVIVPERKHHVILGGPVRFRVEFYAAPTTLEMGKVDETVERPGEDYV